MRLQEVETEVIEAIHAAICLEETEVSIDKTTRMIDDLAMDSLDLSVVLNDLEHRFERRLNTKDLCRMIPNYNGMTPVMTVGHLVAYIQSVVHV